MIQNAYISTTGDCGYFHRENSILYIGAPSPGGDETNVDGFFLHIVSPLELVSLWFLCLGMKYLNCHVTSVWYLWQESLFINVEGKVVQRSVVHPHGTGSM
jgi:hypothetical protein